MNKLNLLLRGPVLSSSGYGSHTRDILFSLRSMNLFNIKIDSCLWGMTPLDALNDYDEFHIWIKENIITEIKEQPDVYVSITVSNEFTPIGKINIGISAISETTIVNSDLISGCNLMDLIIVPSTYTRDILYQTVYNEIDKNTGVLIKQHRIEKPVAVLFEGFNEKIFNNVQDDSLQLDIKEDFAFLFVGNWLKGSLGQDRKDVGMLIKCYVEAFKNHVKKPALILKTTSGVFSVSDREYIINKIKTIVGDVDLPIYLLYGNLTDTEMNSLYNNPKIKSMVSFTKGESFGRPLLEFSITGKPIITSNWSGVKDFLPLDKSILLGGELTEIDESAVDYFLIKNSKWFTVNYNEAIEVLKIVYSDYDNFLKNSEELRIENTEKFSLSKMTESLTTMVKQLINSPKRIELDLPILNKI
jgi:glycosyltransferase involved in cell wall biosynthesis